MVWGYSFTPHVCGRCYESRIFFYVNVSLELYPAPSSPRVTGLLLWQPEAVDLAPLATFSLFVPAVTFPTPDSSAFKFTPARSPEL